MNIIDTTSIYETNVQNDSIFMDERLYVFMERIVKSALRKLLRK